MQKSILIIEYEHPPDLDAYRRHISQALPDPPIDARLARTEAEALALCGHCTALAGKAHAISAALVAAMPRLEWVQALTTGTDALARLDLPPGVTITSMRGIHGPQMSELVFLLMLAAFRDLPSMLSAQAAHRWERRPQRMLAGATVLIVGIGLISEAIAARCLAFGMHVIGASGSRPAANGFAEVYGYNDLGAAAALADAVVVVTPYSAATHHLIDAGVIARMKKTAVLINVARGNVVDEAALADALRGGRIAGAGLDVFAAEPLPAESPFWAMPNVIVTPHIGGMSEHYADQAAPILIANMRAYVEGRMPDGMVNVVGNAPPHTAN